MQPNYQMEAIFTLKINYFTKKTCSVEINVNKCDKIK